MSKRTMLITLALAVVSLTACNKLNSQQKTVTSEAIDALKKVDAASQSGAKYSEYNLVIEAAKREVSEAITVLPESEGELKKSLNESLDAYTDAAAVWKRKAEVGNKAILLEEEPGKALIPKYSLATENRTFPAMPGVTEEKHFTISLIDKSVQQIWSVARTRLNRASTLLSGKEAVSASPTPPPPHVEDGVLSIQAAIVYKYGGPSPVARQSFYCPHRGGLKPSPSGEGFSRFSAPCYIAPYDGIPTRRAYSLSHPPPYCLGHEVS